MGWFNHQPGKNILSINYPPGTRPTRTRTRGRFFTSSFLRWTFARWFCVWRWRWWWLPNTWTGWNPNRNTSTRRQNSATGRWFQISYLGKIPVLTHIFQVGWNHQLEYYQSTRVFWRCSFCKEYFDIKKKDVDFGGIFFPKDVSSQGSSEDCWRISHHTYPTHISHHTYPTHIHHTTHIPHISIQNVSHQYVSHQCVSIQNVCISRFAIRIPPIRTCSTRIPPVRILSMRIHSKGMHQQES